MLVLIIKLPPSTKLYKLGFYKEEHLFEADHQKYSCYLSTNLKMDLQI